ncbi:MAG: glycosyltransferase [Hyphomicrobiales bacterium]
MLNRASGGQQDLKILHILASLEVGGAELLVCDLLKSLKRFPHVDARLLVVNDRVSDELETTLIRNNIPYVRLDRKPGSRRFGDIVRFLRIASTFGPHVIHAHNFFTFFLAGCYKAINPKVKIVNTIHGTNILCRMPGIGKFLFRRLAHINVAVSKAVLDECVSHGVANVRTIHGGIDISRFLAAPRKIENEIAEIVCVARLVPETKGQDTLIEAASFCRKQGKRIHVTLVGGAPTGDNSVVEDLKLLASGLGVADDVQLLGEKHDIPDLLRSADIFVMPSRYEGFGLTLVEAMAAGLPVISSDIDGPQEILQGGKFGLLVPPGDARRLADAIISLITDRQLALSIARSGHKRAADFSIESMTANYLELYENLGSSTI